MKQENLSNEQIEQNKTEHIMNTVAKRAGYYRKNLDKFCADYLGITNLKWFQKILLWAMDRHDNTLLLACRGLGKTYICALFAVCRAILYPGEAILSVSCTYKQSRNLIQKITDDFMLKSPLLRNEISKYSVGQNDCYIQFKSGSIIKAITATESSRGFRSHIILVDESRLIPMKIVSSILRPMNAAPRQPGYLSKPEYAHLAEMPKEVYLTSSWYAMSELYEQAKSYISAMLDGHSFFIVDLPYQVSIKEGLLMKQQIVNEMMESTFQDIIFTMEREGCFYGSAADALYNYSVLKDRRILNDGLFPLEFYRNNNIKMPEKKKDEIRVLSIDIALMGSKKHDNDATCITVHSGVPTPSNDYIDNIIYVETHEGLLSEDLGLMILREYNQFECDYIVIDGSGVGQPIVDYLLNSDRFDPMYNCTYSALNCINNPEIAERCKVKTAPKVIYAIKASAKSNNDMYLSLRAGFQNGVINMLLDDMNVEEEYLSKIRGYGKLTDQSKTLMMLPYVQTTMMINELINLQYDNVGQYIKVREKTGMRKDRVSSCLYGYYVIQELSKGLKPRTTTEDIMSYFTIRKAKTF